MNLTYISLVYSSAGGHTIVEYNPFRTSFSCDENEDLHFVLVSKIVFLRFSEFH